AAARRAYPSRLSPPAPLAVASRLASAAWQAEAARQQAAASYPSAQGQYVHPYAGNNRPAAQPAAGTVPAERVSGERPAAIVPPSVQEQKKGKSWFESLRDKVAEKLASTIYEDPDE
ncbi:MAG: hypothetical protein K2L26_07705, partial [Duncaniella sp.]|nr:hypothetical protein [Duncaniella sp.]